MSSASTGGRKYHTTYGKRGGRVLSSGLSSRDWLAVVSGGNAPAAATTTVNKDLYEGHTGYKDSPTFKSNDHRENYARINDDPRPPRPSHKSLVDLHVKQLQEEHDAIYAAQLDEALNGKRKISLSSGPESEVEPVRVSSSRKASPKTNAETTDGSKKAAVRKAPASRRRIIDLDTPPPARQKAVNIAPVPFPTMAVDASPAQHWPVTKSGQFSDRLAQHMNDTGAHRPIPLGRKDSNNASPAKVREAAVDKLEQTDIKGKGPATREVFAPMVSKQASLHPRSSQPIPRSPLKQSTTKSEPMRYLTSTPRVAQRPSSGVKWASSKAPVNSLLGTHLPPPRGHGSSASVGWRRPLTPSVGKASIPSGQSRKESKSKLDRLIADIVRTDTHGSPLRPKATPAAGLVDRKDAGSGAASASSVPLIGKATSAGVVRAPSALAAQDLSSDLSDLTASTSTAASSRRSASSGSQSEGSPSVASDGFITASSADSSAPEATEQSLSADLSSLLKTCMSISPSTTSAVTLEGIQSFSAFVERCPLLSGAVPHWSKLGEASYSEVFLVSEPGKKTKGPEQLEGSIVVKIIPLHMPIRARIGEADSSFDEDDELPQTSFAHDVNREFQITRALAQMSETSKQAVERTGYSFLRGAYVLKGTYPKPLLDCWDLWERGHREQCQNPRPDAFKEDQLYAVVCLAHGGSDLETVRLKTWSEAASILWQVAESLSRAERELQFEHRDLHWGNILVAPALDTDQVDMPDTATSAYGSSFDKLPSCFAEARTSVTATIIDFTLSRATLPAGVVSGGLEDETIFDGSGDYQFECYRIMKQLNAADWTTYRPTTNIVWLHYLVQKLLKEKKLKKPSARPVPAAANQALPGSPVRGRAGGRRPRVAAPKKVTVSDASFLAEKHCYEALVAAEEILKAAVEAAIGAAEVRKMQAAGPTGKLRTRSKHSSTSSSDDKDLLFRSAGDFVEWWRSE